MLKTELKFSHSDIKSINYKNKNKVKKQVFLKIKVSFIKVINFIQVESESRANFVPKSYF